MGEKSCPEHLHRLWEENMAGDKAPRIRIVDEPPLSVSGKVLKEQLKTKLDKGA